MSTGSPQAAIGRRTGVRSEAVCNAISHFLGYSGHTETLNTCIYISLRIKTLTENEIAGRMIRKIFKNSEKRLSSQERLEKYFRSISFGVKHK